MPRYFVHLSYHGGSYHGWQAQPNAVSVQATLEEAFGKILRSAVSLVGSGRTDTGVHAREQVAHFDFTQLFNPEQFIQRTNRALPKSIVINKMYEVPPSAHARFSAEYRTYEYILLTEKDPFRVGLSYVFPQKLDVSAMNAAAELLLNTKNFQSFSMVKTDVSNFNCTMYEATWYPITGGFIFRVKANRFLRGMVRTLVGTLLQVGQGKVSLDGFQEIILAQDRRAAGPSVPPEGLFLVEVGYPSFL